MADEKILPYKHDHPKRDALIKAGLMEGGPKAAASADPRKAQEKVQAP